MSPCQTGHELTGIQCSNCPKEGGGGRNFCLGGGVERRGGGVEIFFDTGLKKRCGVEFYHQL